MRREVTRATRRVAPAPTCLAYPDRCECNSAFPQRQLRCRQARGDTAPLPLPYAALTATMLFTGGNRLANVNGPLRGLKVLDLSIIVAGGTASNLLADFGAEVVKVERPGNDGEIDAVARRGII